MTRMELVWEFIIQGKYREYGIPYCGVLVNFDLPKSDKSVNGAQLLEEATEHLVSDSMVVWVEDPHNRNILERVAEGVEKSGRAPTAEKFALWMIQQAAQATSSHRSE